MDFVFWICAACVAYTFAGYPLLLAMLAPLRRWPLARAPFTGSVTLVVAARNEANRIGQRVGELVEMLRQARLAGEVIVVSDGSQDGTAEAARRAVPDGPVRVFELPGHVGKAAALTAAWAEAAGQVLVLADARQRWADDALPLLLENFADSQVGAVSGDLVLESAPGVLAGVGLYWRFEKMIRRLESRWHSVVGVTGAICAVRRELFSPMPAGTLLDDVYWPLLVVRKGRRVIHDERAHAFDRLPDRPADEFRRKVRTLSGNFQLVTLLPGLLLPWRNQVWLQWLSHKMLRLAAPWALLGMLLSSALLPGFYRWLLVAQLAGYLAGLAGMFPQVSKRVKLAGAAASFLVLNAAAWLAFWVWLTGRAGRSWHQAHMVKGA